MTVKLNSLKADLAAEADGQWHDIPDLPGVRLKVRGFGYEPFQAAKDALEARWLRQYGRQPVPLAVKLKGNGSLYAKHILLDWEGFDEPYSPDRALAILTDPAFRDMHDHIRYAGGMVGASAVEFAEDAEKNSERPSAGSLSAAAPTPMSGSNG